MPRDSLTHALRAGRVPGDVTTIVPETEAAQVYALLVEIDRKTTTLERIYREARAAYVEAAQQLANHGERFDRRAAQLADLGGTHAFTRPADVDLVTSAEVAT